MQTDEFDFHLPDGLIAQEPVEPRDHSRLMVLRRSEGTWEHRRFFELPEILDPTDLLVRNNTRVVPARLVGKRRATGGRWEGLFLRALPEGRWVILAKTRGRPVLGETIVLDGGLELTLVERTGTGEWVVEHGRDEPAERILGENGRVPLPPYIRKGIGGPDDLRRYQTVYSTTPGAVAAPTAGLHFTDELWVRLAARGIRWTDVTLHVGVGTFRPIEADRIEDHQLHAEWAELTPETAATLNEQRRRGGRVLAVGTTSARTLETASRPEPYRSFAGETSLYLRPGHEFQGFQLLLTNFHLPRSSLLVLVAAFAGFELVRAAYAEAIRERYRFYSYGDAMLIL